MLTDILIVVFCLSSLAGGAMVLFAKEPSRNLLGLLLAAISIGVLFLLLGGAYVSMVQLIVYAGAVLMLFLFVIRYFGHPGRTDRISWQNPLAAIAVLIMIFQFTVPLAPIITGGKIGEWQSPPDAGAIGFMLLTKYLYPFELTSILLLVAIVGAIYMAREDDSDQ